MPPSPRQDMTDSARPSGLLEILPLFKEVLDDLNAILPSTGLRKPRAIQKKYDYRPNDRLKAKIWIARKDPLYGFDLTHTKKRIAESPALSFTARLQDRTIAVKGHGEVVQKFTFAQWEQARTKIEECLIAALSKEEKYLYQKMTKTKNRTFPSPPGKYQI